MAGLLASNRVDFFLTNPSHFLMNRNGELINCNRAAVDLVGGA